MNGQHPAVRFALKSNLEKWEGDLATHEKNLLAAQSRFSEAEEHVRHMEGRVHEAEDAIKALRSEIGLAVRES